MATQRYGRTQNQALLAKIEVVEGTAETLTSATDAMPIEPFTLNMGPNVLESNEATPSIIAGQKVVSRFDSRLSSTLKMRGSGSIVAAPRISAVLQSGGMSEQILAVLPSSTNFSVVSGTTTSVVVDRSTGTGTQLAATNALLAAQLVGRVATLAVNPVTPRDTVIVSATVSGNNVTITFGETFALALSATTTVVVKAGILYQPTTTVPSCTLGGYRDGKLVSLVGCRPKLSFTLPGAERPTVAADFGGTYVSETDVAVPSDIDFTALPAEALWRNGRAWLQKLETACSNYTLDLQTTDTKYPNPNIQYGLDRNILTKQDPGGTLTLNDKLVAYQDIKSLLAANTLMPFIAVTDTAGSAGSRWAHCIPNLLLLDDGDGDREGIIEAQLRFQAVFRTPTPAFTWFNY
jgi:hypothetical protein